MKKLLIGLFCVFLLIGCSSSTQEAQEVVHAYCQQMQNGNETKANTYLLEDIQSSGIEEMAKEAGYSGKIKSYFTSYMKHLIGKQWDSFEIRDISQGSDYYLVTVQVKGISAEDLEQLNEEDLVTQLQSDLTSTQDETEKEKLFQSYFKELENQVDTLPLIERTMVFQVVEKENAWKIKTMELEN